MTSRRGRRCLGLESAGIGCHQGPEGARAWFAWGDEGLDLAFFEHKTAQDRLFIETQHFLELMKQHAEQQDKDSASGR